MPENVRVQPALSGIEVATDEVTINGVVTQVQRVKLALGPDNVYQKDLAAGASDVAGSLPVVLASDHPSIPVAVDGPITVEVSAPLSTNVENEVDVHLVNQLSDVSTLNSSADPLGQNQFYSGSGEDALGYAALVVTVTADVDSAVDGLQVQQSQTGATWDFIDRFTVFAGQGFTTVVQIVGQFFRVNYQNGGDLQNQFRLQVTKVPLFSPLPRSLTPQGNLRVAYREPLRGSFTDASGTIDTGGTAQDVLLLNPFRNYLYFQNVSDTAMRIAFGSQATAASQIVPANGGEVKFDGFFVPVDLLSVFCASSGKEYVAREA